MWKRSRGGAAHAAKVHVDTVLGPGDRVVHSVAADLEDPSISVRPYQAGWLFRLDEPLCAGTAAGGDGTVNSCGAVGRPGGLPERPLPRSRVMVALEDLTAIVSSSHFLVPFFPRTK